MYTSISISLELTSVCLRVLIHINCPAFDYTVLFTLACNYFGISSNSVCSRKVCVLMSSSFYWTNFMYDEAYLKIFCTFFNHFLPSVKTTPFPLRFPFPTFRLILETLCVEWRNSTPRFRSLLVHIIRVGCRLYITNPSNFWFHIRELRAIL